jgi:putative methionine-R-sulfoxide reductase with GAF domain
VSSQSGALEAIDRILNRGGDADDVLRQVVSILQERVEGCTWAGISFVEGGKLVLGPEQGNRGGDESVFPVSYEGSDVAELRVVADGLDADNRALLERVAVLISPYCLVGWDTGGEAWSP